MCRLLHILVQMNKLDTILLAFQNWFNFFISFFHNSKLCIYESHPSLTVVAGNSFSINWKLLLAKQHYHHYLLTPERLSWNSTNHSFFPGNLSVYFVSCLSTAGVIACWTIYRQRRKLLQWLISRKSDSVHLKRDWQMK